MALITSCQASFQNVAGYEDDIAFGDFKILRADSSRCP